MKILMVVGNYFPQSCGGTEVFTQLLAEGLVNRGHSVAVLCIGDNDTDEVINGVRVYRRRVRNIRVFINSRLVKWINQSLHLYNPFNKGLVKDIVRKEKSDILHLQMARTLSFSVLQAAIECNIGTTHTLHELFSMWKFNAYMRDCVEKILSKPTPLVNLYRSLHKRITARVDYVTAPSRFALDSYLDDGYYAGVPSRVIANSVPPTFQADDSNSAKPERSNSATSPIRFLFLGRVDYYKGLEETLEAFQSLSHEINAELHIAGDGRLAPLAKKHASDNPLIVFHGFVYDQAKTDLLSQCDVLFFPSTWVETFGLVILEAYEHGMPVVGTRVGAIPELVDDGKTGLLINKGIDNLKQAMRTMANRNQVESMRAFCREAIQRFEFDRFIEAHEIVYHEIMQRKM